MSEKELTVEIMSPAGKLVKVNSQRLEELANAMSRVVTVKISSDRRLNIGNYQTEGFVEGADIDFNWFWDMIPSSALYDNKEQAIMIKKAFANGLNRSIGEILRRAYVNQLFCVSARANQLKLPQRVAIDKEIQQLNSSISFDPFDVVEKEEEKE